MNDKKVAKGKLNLILLKSIGAAFKTDKFKQTNLSKAFKLQAAFAVVAFKRSLTFNAAGETNQKSCSYLSKSS